MRTLDQLSAHTYNVTHPPWTLATVGVDSNKPILRLPKDAEIKLEGNESQGRMYNFLIVIIMFPLD